MASKLVVALKRLLVADTKKQANVGIGDGEFLFVSDKPTQLKGKVCPKCNKQNVWFTCYIGFNVPNVKCHSCGFEWLMLPETKLEIKGEY